MGIYFTTPSATISPTSTFSVFNRRFTWLIRMAITVTIVNISGSPHNIEIWGQSLTDLSAYKYITIENINLKLNLNLWTSGLTDFIFPVKTIDIEPYFAFSIGFHNGALIPTGFNQNNINLFYYPIYSVTTPRLVEHSNIDYLSKISHVISPINNKFSVIVGSGNYYNSSQDMTAIYNKIVNEYSIPGLYQILLRPSIQIQGEII
jgi:hypothetical protein